MKENIIFDLGEVLVNTHPDRYLAKLGYTGEKKEKLADIIFRDGAWPVSDLGVYDSYKELALAIAAHHPEFRADILKFFNPAWIEEVYTPLAEGKKLFETLAKQRYNLYILSNFLPDAFLDIYRKYDFFSLSKGYIVSSFVGYRKPDRHIFELLLSTYHLERGMCLFIDDSKENIQAGKDIGLDGFVYQDYADALKELSQRGISLKDNRIKKSLEEK